MVERAVDEAARIMKNSSLAVPSVIVIGAIVTVLSFLFLNNLEEKQEQSVFAATAEQHTNVMKDRLFSAIEAVRSIAALYAATESVTRSEFSKFAKIEMSDQPNIQALEWIPRVRNSERGEFESLARKDGLAGFSFTDRHSQGNMVRADKRDEYFPVYFIEPLKGNEAAAGFDLASSPTRLEALNAARDSGQLQATARITLVQETGDSYGLLVFQPVYRDGVVPETLAERRDRLIGFGLGVLRVSDILGSEETGRQRHETFVFDESAPPGQQTLFPVQSSYQSRNDIKGRTCADFDLQVGRRPWSVIHCQPEEYDYLAHHPGSLIALIAGLLLTALLAAYLQMLTKQRRATLRLVQRLQASEARYSDIVDSTQIMIQSINPHNDSYIYTNNGWKMALGYSDDETLNLKISDVVHPDHLEHYRTILSKALSGDPVEDAFLTFVDKAGTPVEVEGQIFCRQDEGGNLITHGIFTDITKRKESAAQVIQASKLATLGEMATSIAHELNQPLNVIRMAAGNAVRQIAKGTAEPAYLKIKLERIAAQTERAAAIIDHMRMFGRKTSEEPELLAPCEVVNAALDLVGEQLRLSEISVVKDLSDDCKKLGKVLGHRIQVEQVILNLLTNARDAIVANGTDKKITLSVRFEDEIVRLAVQDTGGGIPEKIIERIFEPFYTTKKMGMGTGLGLSVSYGIIRDMGGTIKAENVEHGARFTITLPVVESSS